MTKYFTISLPENLIKEIDEKIRKFPYSSRADFVKQASRRELEKLRGDSA